MAIERVYVFVCVSDAWLNWVSGDCTGPGEEHSEGMVRSVCQLCAPVCAGSECRAQHCMWGADVQHPVIHWPVHHWCMSLSMCLSLCNSLQLFLTQTRLLTMKLGFVNFMDFLFPSPPVYNIWAMIVWRITTPQPFYGPFFRDHSVEPVPEVSFFWTLWC